MRRRHEKQRLLMRLDTHEWMLNALRGLLMYILVHSVQGEARCYCNDPSCVSTSYMCKSPLGVCFSQLLQDGVSTDVLRTRHACAEMLPEVDQRTCIALTDSTVSGLETRRSIREVEGSWTDLICCTTDMCNYKNKLGINIYTNRQRNNVSIEVLNLRGTALDSVVRDHQLDERQLWFRAAVIAVPLVGAFILLVLAFTAARIVTRDQHHQPRDPNADRVIKFHLPSLEYRCNCVTKSTVSYDSRTRCCCCNCCKSCSSPCNTSRDYHVVVTT